MTAAALQPEPEKAPAEKSTALIEISKINPVQVFTTEGGAEKVLAEIAERARSVITGDISTEKGRKEIKSLAYKIAQSKTAIDDLGKGFVEDLKVKVKAVDAERKKIREGLEALQEEIRKPVTDWEDAEEARVKAHENALEEMTTAAQFALENWESLPIESLKERKTEIENQYTGRQWQEFFHRAKHETTINLEKVDKAIKHKEGQLELERMRAAEAERQKKEHEQKLKEEAAAKAKKEAEEKAAAEAKAAEEKAAAEKKALEDQKAAAEAAAKKAEEDRIAAEKKAADDLKAAEQAKADADARAKKAEEEKAAAEKKAEEDRIAAEAKAKKDAEEAQAAADKKAKEEAEAAAQRERDKIAAEEKAKADAAAKREADLNHKRKINNEALAAVLKAMQADDILEDQAKAVIEAIALGQVPNVKIFY